MQYVLDTGFFVLTRGYYPDTFPTFWEEMDKAARSRLISSVIEVKKEIEKFGGEQTHLSGWIKSNANIFTKPEMEEQDCVRDIFDTDNFQNLIGKQKILEGGPFADPFVIAKANIIEGIVVTNERPAKKDKNGRMQGAPKIPDVCEHFDVECILPEEFMRRVSWKF